MNLAHNQHDVRELKRRTHANRLNGIDCEWLNVEQVKKFCPIINCSPNIRYPVMGSTLQRRLVQQDMMQLLGVTLEVQIPWELILFKIVK